MTRPDHRADIEGLRAIAILLVVAAHVGIETLDGGFVGVDVFFVLSGYLITSQLAKELTNTGRIQLALFYARRLRRLLPALLTVLLISCLGGWLLYPPGDFPRQAFAAAAASIWLSNFYFALSGMDYFSPQVGDNLFLHTWSLGVEEQFYLLWPLLLLLAAWMPKSAAGMATRLKAMLLAVFLLSLTACVLLTQKHPVTAFYMMPMRAWQFALGGLVFLCLDAHKEPASALGWTGLMAVLGSALLLSENMTYPGLWALLPSLGAAMLLASGNGAQSNGVTRLLAWHPMQQIGRVSYVWYLWHWPVLLLGTAVMQTPSLADRLALALLSLLLAAATHWLIEQPIRHNTRLIAKPGHTVLGALVLMAVAHLAAINLHNQALAHTISPAQMEHLKVRSDVAAIYAMGCDDWYHGAEVKICAFGPADAEHTAVIVGDSIGLQWFPAAAAAFNRPGWKLLAITKSSCPMVDAPIHYARIGREYTECAEWRQAALQQIAALKPDVVIMGSTFTYDLDQSAWTQGSARVMATLGKAARSVYVLRSTSVLPFDAPTCLAPRSAIYEWLAADNRCSASPEDPHGERVYGWLKTAAADLSNVTMLDMTDAVCPNNLCRADLNGMTVFRDRQHLSARFAQSLGPVLADRLSLDQ